MVDLKIPNYRPNIPNMKWGENTVIYTATQPDEVSNNFSLSYSPNVFIPKYTYGIFTKELTDKMDHTPELFGIKLGKKQVRSLSDAFKELPSTVSETMDILDESGKVAKSITITEHPQHSVNANNDKDKDGWIPTKIHLSPNDPNQDNDKDHHRISKAILIEGDQRGVPGTGAASHNNINMMAAKLKDDYGLNDDDIKIIKAPDHSTLGQTFTSISDAVGDNSQALIYYAGHGKDNCLVDNKSTDFNDLMDKSVLQYLINTRLSKCKHVSVVLDCCGSGSFTKDD